MYIFWLGFIVFAAISRNDGDSSFAISTSALSPFTFGGSILAPPVTVMPLASSRCFRMATKDRPDV